MDARRARRTAALAAGALVGAAWLAVALLAEFDPGFALHGAFRELGGLFWVAFTVVGLALAATLSWAALAARPAPAAPRAEEAQPGASRPAPGWNPAEPPTRDGASCARCGRTLPPWRAPEGTCTVCAPYSAFLARPRQPNPEAERRRNRLFLLQGLGAALLALAFVSAVYLFPIVLAPQRPVLAALGFLVFSPLLFGLVLLMYARSQAAPEAE